MMILVYLFFSVQWVNAQDVHEIIELHFQKDLTRQEIENQKQLLMLESQDVQLSPWGGELESRFMFKRFIEDINTSILTSNSSSLDFRLSQKTPYGLKFTASLDRILTPPETKNFIQTQNLNLGLEMSLYQDFLGRNTKLLQNSQANPNQIHFALSEFYVNRCYEIKQTYSDFWLSSVLNEIYQESHTQNQKLLGQIRRAKNRGSIESLDYMSFVHENLNSELKLNSSASDLLEQRRQFRSYELDLTGVTPMSFLNANWQPDSSLLSQSLGVYDEKMRRINNSIHGAQLRRNQDVFLFVNYKGTDFRQQSLGQSDGHQDSLNVGLGFKMSWGQSSLDQSLKLNQAKLAQLQSEKQRAEVKLKRFKQEANLGFKSSVSLFLTQKKQLVSHKNYSEKVRRLFLKGSATYQQFLAARQSWVSQKISLAQSERKILKEQIKLQFELKDVKALCGFEPQKQVQI